MVGSYRARALFAGLLVSIALLGLACSTRSGEEAVRAKWLTANVSGDSALLPVADIQANRMTHFSLATTSGDIAFMAYTLGDKLYARASICPPCRSDQFSLKGERLICDTCGTVFDAGTGEGIEGACRAFAKAPVAYELSQGSLAMKAADLISAYRDTLEPGS